MPGSPAPARARLEARRPTVGGAVVATLIGQNLGWYAHGDKAGFLASVGGAVVLLVGYEALKPRAKREARMLPPER